MIMHESQPDPPEPEEEDEEHDSGFDVPDGDDAPELPANYPPTVAAFFDAAGITQPRDT